jgi:hypothetical protein
MAFCSTNRSVQFSVMTSLFLTINVLFTCSMSARTTNHLPAKIKLQSDTSLTKAQLRVRKTTRLALFIPGAGQLSNRNYFKAACVWGGMAYGVKYLIDNTQDLRDTRSQLIDAVTPPIAGFATINTLTEQETYDQRFRDISWLILIGIHGLSILDAHVSANLQTFDVSEDLSLRLGFLRLPNESALGLSLNWRPQSK